MVRSLALGAFILAACYQRPSFTDSCKISCETECPDGLSCDNGRCHPTGGLTCDQMPIDGGIDAVVDGHPLPTHGYLDVHVGARHACGRDVTKAIYCWGDGGQDQLGVVSTPSSTTPIRVGSAGDQWDALSVGAEHTCAIQFGDVWCWGRTQRGQATGGAGSNVPVELPAAVSVPTHPHFDTVTAGGVHTCALSVHDLWCWGATAQNGTGSGSSTPVQVEAGTLWQQVSAGVDHTCAVHDDGVYCWGANDKLQSSATAGAVPTPSKITLPTSAGTAHVVRVIASARISCAILSDTQTASSGSLWCWGDNGADSGAPHILDPTVNAPTSIAMPTQIGTDTDWTDASGGQNFMCGARGGQVYCWGGTDAGALGTGKWTTLTSPSNYNPGQAVAAADTVSVGVGSDTNPISVDDVACMLADNHISCWGGNEHGSLGQGNVSQHVSPIEVPAPAGSTGGWLHLYGGDRHLCAMTADRAVWCWGADDLGQVSAGTSVGSDDNSPSAPPCTLDRCDRPVPTAMPGLANVQDVRAGVDFTCALDDSGAVQCWGKGTAGELGGSAATTTHDLTPVPGSFSALLGGGSAMCATAAGAGSAECWGQVPHTGQKVFGPVPVAAPGAQGMVGFAFGPFFGCGIDMTGHRICWGSNNQLGALGNGSQSGSVQNPTDLGSDGAVQITAAGSHGCAVTMAGNVECWGDNNREQCGTSGSFVLSPAAVTDGTNPLTSCSEVRQSTLLSCARCGSPASSVLCWGVSDTGGGGAALPAQRPRALALSGSHDFSELAVYARGGCALDALATPKKLFCWGRGYRGENGDGGHATNLPTPILDPP